MAFSKLFLQICLVFMFTLLVDGTTISTVCHGPEGVPCTTHRLTCSSSSLIEIINTTYGYRDSCQSGISLAGCNNITCCEEQTGDCFVDFPDNDSQKVLDTCNNKMSCSIGGLRQIDKPGCNGRYSAYSKIEYICRESLVSTTQTTPTVTVVTQSSSTETATTKLTQKTTETSTKAYNNSLLDQTNNKADIVGGVLGTLLIISIIINIAFIVYILRKIRSSSERRQQQPQSNVNQYEGTVNTGSDSLPNTYASLNNSSQSGTYYNHDGKEKLDGSHTYYNTTNNSTTASNSDQFYVNIK